MRGKGGRVRDAWRRVLLGLVAVATTAGCTAGGSSPTTGDRMPAGHTSSPVAEATPPPTLTRAWSTKGWLSNPDRAGRNHWVTLPVRRDGIGRATSSTPHPLLLVDARAGRRRTHALPGQGWPCRLPATLSGSGVTPVLLSSHDARTCDRLRSLDADTGEVLWEESLPAVPTSGVVVGADDDVVVVTDARRVRLCATARAGDVLAPDSRACRALAERLTHADLPRLTDAQGQPAPLRRPWLEDTGSGPVEIGRTDDLLLVQERGQVDVDGILEPYAVVRAHDLETGRTLWEDAELEPDPYGGTEGWNREETYLVAPWGVARVSYEHPEETAAGVAPATPMVVTAVDPRTGEDLHPVARVEGAWFNRQLGPVLVALTDQERLLHSRISGFRLPRW